MLRWCFPLQTHAAVCVDTGTKTGAGTQETGNISGKKGKKKKLQVADLHHDRQKHNYYIKTRLAESLQTILLEARRGAVHQVK